MKRISLNVDDIVRMYTNGMSTNALAKMFGVSRRVIDDRLINRGMALRTRRESALIKWQKMTVEQRVRQVEKAHKATIGRTKTFDEKCKAAITRQHTNERSHSEIILEQMLIQSGIVAIPQQVIGPYNCDLGAHPIAVECFGGHWHFTGRHARREPERLRYLMNSGWHVLYILITMDYPLLISAAEYIVSFFQYACTNPSIPREYRMIGGTGELFLSGSSNDEHLSIIPPFTNRRNPTTGRYERVPRNA